VNSRPVGIAGLGPLFGVRAIAEAAGLDGRQVMALMESGAGHSLAPRIAARQVDRGRPPSDRWDMGPDLNEARKRILPVWR